MAKGDGKKSARQQGAQAPRKGSGTGARFFAGIILLALVAYILGGAALGTAWVRDSVCERLSSAVGMKVEAQSSKLGMPFTIVLQDVKTESYETGAAGFMFRAMRITPSLSGGWNVSAESGSLRLWRRSDGVWDPPVFAEIGGLPSGDLRSVSAFAAAFCRDITLEVSELTVRWVAGDREVAAAGGVSFAVKPGELPGRSVLHHVLAAASVVGPGGARSSNVRREWLAGTGIPYKELSRDGDNGGNAFLEGAGQ